MRREPETVTMVCLIAAAVSFELAFGLWRESWHVGRDVYAFWSFSRFMRSHSAAELYDPATICGFQHDACMPMLYPPPTLFLFWPFASLGLRAATAIWMAATIPLFLLCFKMRDWVFVLLAPMTIWCWHNGQMTFLVGALLLGGLRLVERRPALGGVLLGALVIKPQFAILVPIALLAARNYRALAAAALAASALCAASAAVFGLASWGAFFQALGGARAYTGYGLSIMIVTQSAALQLAGFVVAAVIVWRRPDANTLLRATFLAAPYTRVYDEPLLLPAILDESPVVKAVTYLLPCLLGLAIPYWFGFVWIVFLATRGIGTASLAALAGRMRRLAARHGYVPGAAAAGGPSARNTLAP